MLKDQGDALPNYFPFFLVDTFLSKVSSCLIQTVSDPNSAREK